MLILTYHTTLWDTLTPKYSEWTKAYLKCNGLVSKIICDITMRLHFRFVPAGSGRRLQYSTALWQRQSLMVPTSHCQNADQDAQHATSIMPCSYSGQ